MINRLKDVRHKVITLTTTHLLRIHSLLHTLIKYYLWTSYGKQTPEEEIKCAENFPDQMCSQCEIQDVKNL
jgi:hypothetical protein